MGFYGNMSNAGKTQLSFDKIYPNRAQMEAQTSTDGVFIGRRVLVEYDDNTKPRRRGYIKSPPSKKDELYVLYSDDTFFHAMVHTPNSNQDYGLAAGDIIYVQRWDEYYYFQTTTQVNEQGHALFQYILRASELSSEDDPLTVSDYTLNYEQDKKYATEKDISFINGWDSTIWEKGYVNGVEKYFMVASLNSVLPTMTIDAEAPSTIPRAPHFAENSTNMLYTLHMSSPWGFRMKPAETLQIGEIDGKPITTTLCDVKEKISWLTSEEDRQEYLKNGGKEDDIEYYPAVFYNKKGFSPDKISQSDVATEFSISPTGISKKRYITHDEGETPGAQVDLQELKVHLPDIGNMMSNVWNVVYGDEKVNEGLVRNLNVSWGNKTGLRLIGSDPRTGSPTFNTQKASTIAGCINSVQDLMGTNIISVTTPKTPDEAPDSEDAIFYGPLGPDGKVGFYYKDIEYVLTSFAEKGLNQNDYTGEKQYVDLEQFEANKYYYYQNFNFYLETNNYPQSRTSYYLLDEPIDIEVLAWPPEDESGEKIYPFYKDEPNYIQDIGDVPKDGVVHYHIQDSQATDVLVSEKQDGNDIVSTKGTYPVLIWNPNIIHMGLSEVETEALVKVNPEIANRQDVQKYKKGFFKLEIKDGVSKLSAVTGSDKYDKNTTYYYLPAYAVALGGTIGGDEPETLYLPDNEYLVSFSDLHSASGASDLLKEYAVTFKQFKKDTYFSKYIDEENDYRIIYYALTSEDQADPSKHYYTLDLTYAAGEDESGAVEEEDVAYYYTAYRYFIKPTNGSKNYILDTSKSKNPKYTYCILTQKGIVEGKEVLRQLIVDPETHLVDAVPVDTVFYEPDKYYYWSKSRAEDILDQSLVMKQPVADKASVDYEITADNKIYYLVNYAYVVEDTSGILSVGSVWNKTELASDGVTVKLVNPPEGVTLGVREEKPKWTEMKGLASRRNTIHGRLLDINLLFRFDDTIVRDNASVSGCMHKMKDFVRMIGKLNPGEIPTIDEYGRISSTNLNGVTLTGYSAVSSSSAALANTDTLLAALKKLEGQISALKTRIATLEGKVT